MKKQQFVNMIRKLVAEEVKKQLPNILSEMYVKKLVSEGVEPVSKPNRKVSFEEMFSEKMEEKQQSVENYSPPRKNVYEYYNVDTKPQPKPQHPALADDNPMRHLYEDVGPVEEPYSNPMMDQMMNQRFDFGRMNEITRATENRTSGPIPQTNDAQMRELQRRRDELDKMKVG